MKENNKKNSSFTSFPQNDDFVLGLANDCSSHLSMEDATQRTVDGLSRHCEENTEYSTWQSHSLSEMRLLCYFTSNNDETTCKKTKICYNSDMLYHKNDRVCIKKAFTLAEVLITLGIIGVVAALTIPVLTASARKSEIESRLKKFYSVMSQAILFSENENGPVSSWDKTGMVLLPDGSYDSAANDILAEEYFEQYLAKYLVITSRDYYSAGGRKWFRTFLLMVQVHIGVMVAVLICSMM